MNKQQFVKKLGALIRQERQKQNISIEELAFKSSVTFARISLFERGKSGIEIYTFYKITKELGIDLFSAFDSNSTDEGIKEMTDFKEEDLKSLLDNVKKLTRTLKSKG